MTLPKLPQDVEAGNAAVHVHQHLHQPRPVAVADDEQARAIFGWPHKRTTYRALGVAVAELPGGRFAVLVADVEAALRARASAPSAAAPAPAEDTDDDDDRALLARAGLRLASGGRR